MLNHPRERRFRRDHNHHGGEHFGPGHHPHGHRSGRGRAPRGDVRAAVLLLLSEEPMHGYQLMQAIADRTDGRWSPSPGTIYPTLSQLEDEGLVHVTAEAGRKLAALTATGLQHVEERRDNWPDPFASHGGRDGGELRNLLEQVHHATRQVARTGDDAQRRAAEGILTETRRTLYLLLAEGSPADPKTDDS